MGNYCRHWRQPAATEGRLSHLFFPDVRMLFSSLVIGNLLVVAHSRVQKIERNAQNPSK